MYPALESRITKLERQLEMLKTQVPATPDGPLAERIATLNTRMPHNNHVNLEEGHLHREHFSPACRVYNDADITTTTATAIALTFNSERFDNDNMHSTSTNTGRITIRSSGIYLVGVNVQWNNNATGQRQTRLRLNGSTIIAFTKIDEADSATEEVIQSVNCIYSFDVDDYVEVVASQASGGDLTVEVAANYSPEFWAVKLAELP